MLIERPDGQRIWTVFDANDQPMFMTRCTARADSIRIAEQRTGRTWAELSREGYEVRPRWERPIRVLG